MKRIERLILLFCVLAVFLCACKIQSASIIDPHPTSTATPIASADATNSEKKQTSKSEIECVRSKPKPIIDNKIFPATTFKLEEDKEIPNHSNGIETVEFNNGDKLLIENTGCESYTLIFHYETARFLNDPEDIKAWYKNAIKLLEQTTKGIREPKLTIDATKALKSYLKKTTTAEYDKDIDFGGDEIRSLVSVKPVEKLTEKRYKIEISIGVGPL